MENNLNGGKRGQIDFNQRLQEAIQKADCQMKLAWNNPEDEEREFLRQGIVDAIIQKILKNRGETSLNSIMNGLRIMLDELSVDWIVAHRVFEDIQEIFRLQLLQTKERRSNLQSY